ncbi:hypothetical protein LFZ25_26595 (plasmid) [Salmonella enterica subsp. enterica serovar Macclesfield str. S-1643]|uniref:Uncharacterized protein n=1 Tax=Salmonella enterica subsp. enterica serovar Macclesfield str. S-1643 TaxID=1242107 RepID=A0A241PYH7_SALET|nr:hypothetical protein LFZ25_26595 [Salmonella enterica subsp. enterica serovar Macclesfield str. S-1643]
MIKKLKYRHTVSLLFQLRRKHFTDAQRICTTAQCFHIYLINAGEIKFIFCFPALDNRHDEISVRRQSHMGPD